MMCSASMPMDQEDAPDPVPTLLKIVLIGDSGVGKSSLLLQYVDGKFTPGFMATFGVDYRAKFLTVGEDQLVKLQIYDTAGQERYRAITRDYFRCANGICFIFDLCCRNSFDNIKVWLRDVESTISYPVAKILVGMKQDLESRVISLEEGQDLAESLNMDYIEASAKTGFNVETVFSTLTATALSAAGDKVEFQTIAEKLVEVNLVILEPEVPEPDVVEEKKSRCCR